MSAGSASPLPGCCPDPAAWPGVLKQAEHDDAIGTTETWGQFTGWEDAPGWV